MGSNRPGMLFGEKRKLLWSLLAGQSPFLIHRKLWYGTHSQHIRNLLVFFLLWMFYFSELMFAWRTVLVRECWCRKLISIAFKFFSFFSFSLSLSLLSWRSSQFDCKENICYSMNTMKCCHGVHCIDCLSVSALLHKPPQVNRDYASRDQESTFIGLAWSGSVHGVGV